MEQFSVDTVKELTPHMLKTLGFQDLLETLSMLDSVYTMLDLTRTFGKPNFGTALAFRLGVECCKRRVNKCLTQRLAL